MNRQIPICRDCATTKFNKFALWHGCWDTTLVCYICRAPNSDYYSLGRLVRGHRNKIMNLDVAQIEVLTSEYGKLLEI